MQKTDTAQRTAAPPVIDVPQSGNLPATRAVQAIAHIEPESVDMDQEIDRKLGLQPEGFEIAMAPNFKAAIPFPREVQDVLKLFRNVPDEMIDIKPNGHVYLSNRYASEIFDEAFGIGGWVLIPVKTITERKVMKKGTSAEYEIVTVYTAFRAYALGQYIRDVSGAGVYFSNNPEQNYSDAVESAESYAINRMAKRLGIGRNLRDPIAMAAWVAKYAYQDSADGNKWKKRPAAGGVPVPPNGVRSWTAQLVRLFKPVVGEDTAQLADALEKLTVKAWGVEKSTRSFRDLTNIEAYELCRRIGEGELAVPTIAPRRASEAKAQQEAAKWPPARRDEWTEAHKGEGKPECKRAGCQACRWDEWEMGATANVQVVDETAPAVKLSTAAEIKAAMGPAPTAEIAEQARAAGAQEDRRLDAAQREAEAFFKSAGLDDRQFKCETCEDNGCAMCLGDRAGDDEEIPPAGDRATVEAAMVGTLCPKPRHGRYAGLFCPACEDPSLLDDVAAAEREAAERDRK